MIIFNYYHNSVVSIQTKNFEFKKWKTRNINVFIYQIPGSKIIMVGKYKVTFIILKLF